MLQGSARQRSWWWLAVVLPSVAGCGLGQRRPAPLTPYTAAAPADEAQRDPWQRPGAVIDLMRIAPGMRVADVGAGNGYLLQRLSEAVGPLGKVYAIEVQPALLAQLRARVASAQLANVTVVAASPAGVLLPEPIDRAVLLHSYRELAEPVQMLRSIKAWLQPGGRVVTVEFLSPPDPPDGAVPLPVLPPAAQRVDPQTLEAEARGAGLVAIGHFAVLPHQHCTMFVNAEELTSAQLEGVQPLEPPAAVSATGAPAAQPDPAPAVP